MHTRHSEVYLKQDHSPCSQDSYYVVELWEFGKCIAIVPCGDHSRYWADSVAENWFCGVLTYDKMDPDHLTKEGCSVARTA